MRCRWLSCLAHTRTFSWTGLCATPATTSEPPAAAASGRVTRSTPSLWQPCVRPRRPQAPLPRRQSAQRRIMAQIVYYFYAGLALGASDHQRYTTRPRCSRRVHPRRQSCAVAGRQVHLQLRQPAPPHRDPGTQPSPRVPAGHDTPGRPGAHAHQPVHCRVPHGHAPPGRVDPAQPAAAPATCRATGASPAAGPTVLRAATGVLRTRAVTFPHTPTVARTVSEAAPTAGSGPVTPLDVPVRTSRTHAARTRAVCSDTRPVPVGLLRHPPRRHHPAPHRSLRRPAPRHWFPSPRRSTPAPRGDPGCCGALGSGRARGRPCDGRAGLTHGWTAVRGG